MKAFLDKVVGVNVSNRVVSVIVSQCSDMNLSGWMSQFFLGVTGLEVVIMGENGTSFMTTVMSTAVWWDPSCHDCHDYHATFMTDTSDVSQQRCSMFTAPRAATLHLCL